jgi:hypothetical protein
MLKCLPRRGVKDTYSLSIYGSLYIRGPGKVIRAVMMSVSTRMRSDPKLIDTTRIRRRIAFAIAFAIISWFVFYLVNIFHSSVIVVILYFTM